MYKVDKQTAPNLIKFEPYGSGNPVKMRQYAYSDTHIFATIQGIEYVAEIDDRQNAYLRSLSANDFVNPARLFAEVSSGPD